MSFQCSPSRSIHSNTKIYKHSQRKGPDISIAALWFVQTCLDGNWKSNQLYQCQNHKNQMSAICVGWIIFTEYRFPSVYGFKVLETLSSIASMNYTFVNLKKYFAFSSYHQDCRRASSEGWEPDLLRPRLHHQAQVHGGEHRGGAARVHHLEEGEQDAQLRHWEGRHQVWFTFYSIWYICSNIWCIS